MHGFEKYLKKLTELFDVSPIESGGITKILVYSVWGINALIFLGKDIDFTPDFCGAPHSCIHSSLCTALKKVSSTDLYIEHFTFVSESQFVVISSYDYELPVHDVIPLPRDRSPPVKPFS